MKTRRSRRNQNRLWKAIGKELAAKAAESAAGSNPASVAVAEQAASTGKDARGLASLRPLSRRERLWQERFDARETLRAQVRALLAEQETNRG